jgi:hypothetical protein
VIYDETNYRQLLGNVRSERLQDGHDCAVHVDNLGQKRYLSRVLTPRGNRIMESLPKFADNFPVYSREECFERWQRQKAGALRSIEDYQNFDPHDQDGLPSCWRNGSAHGFTTQEFIVSGKLEYISANSLCPDISFHVGGDEWNSAQSLVEDGGATQDIVANNETSRSAFDRAEVAESRKHHHAFQLYRFSGSREQMQLQMMTAECMEMPMCGPIAHDWWSHVISISYFYFTGSTASSSVVNVPRNNWGNWGQKNKYGKYGYVELAEGHGTPDSGCVFGPRLVTAA